MTEPEAEALVAKLMRIWELRLVDQWGFFDGYFYLRTQYDSNTLLDINPLIEVNSCHLDESAAFPSLPSHRRSVDASPSYLCALENGEVYVQSVQGYSTDEVTNARHRAEFSEKWMPLLRRNCWLMGYNIGASREEKLQWSQSFEEVAEVEPSQIVSDKIRRERRRVAAAFGIEEWTKQFRDWSGLLIAGSHNEIYVSCHIDDQVDIRELEIQNADNPNRGLDKAPSCRVLFDRWDGWYFIPCAEFPQYNHIMSHGLYRLGFEREAFSPKLKVPSLSDHEKAELRLSMPREFWPKTWLSEASDA